MGMYKTLKIERKETEIKYNLKNRDDIFDLVFDSFTTGQPLPAFTCYRITLEMGWNTSLASLFQNPDFVAAWDWNGAQRG